MVTANPLRNSAAKSVKKSKPPPPLPPPKPMSEEKIRREEKNMYEEISDDENDEEYTAISQMVPEPEGGVERYDYADMERGIRPMSYHQDEYGGSGGSVTGTSGGGTFQSNDDSDTEEYIEPKIVSAPPIIVHQNSQPIKRNQYMNTNTLDGRDLSHAKPPEVKIKTLPKRTPPHKEKSPVRKPLGLPDNKPVNLNSSLDTGSSSELMNMLSRRKQQVEGSNSAANDDVFVKEEPTKVAFKTKPVYQVCMRILHKSTSIALTC